MKKMTSKERLMNILKGKDVDRAAFKLWGLYPKDKLLSPKYKEVYELAMRVTDIFTQSHPINYEEFGTGTEYIYTEKDIDGNFYDRNVSMITPTRTLNTVVRASRLGEPEYTLEHYVKDAQDLRALVDVEYEPYPVDLKPFHEQSGLVGDRGVVYYNLDHTGYMVQRLMGPELFSYMLYDEPELILETARIFQRRLIKEVKAVLETGITPVFGWCGPEICIPPHTSLDVFESLVFDMDKPICDLIHNGGGYVWGHCHGQMKRVIGRFADMGVDLLNPIEPPPLGDVSLAEAISLGKGIGVEGNIEIMWLLQDNEDVIRAAIDTALSDTTGYGRFVLGLSAGFEEYVNPSDNYLNNLMVYLKYGAEKLGVGR